MPPVAPGGDPVPGDQSHHAEGDADHDLEGDVDDAWIGLVRGRPLVQSPYDGVRIVEGEEAEQTRDPDGVRVCRVSSSGQPPTLNAAPASVWNRPSSAASFGGWLSATQRALMSPLIGCSGAKTAARAMASVNPAR